MTAREIMDVVNNGVFWHPASEHYGYETIVSCDQCKEDKLPSCLGIKGGKVDVCLPCATKIKALVSTSSTARRPDGEPLTYMREAKYEPQTKMRQSMFVTTTTGSSSSRLRPLTRMRPEMFDRSDGEFSTPKTRMRQSSFHSSSFNSSSKS